MYSFRRNLVSGIALVKPEKAELIGNAIIAEARMGRLIGKITDQQLIQRIESLDATEAKTTLTISHKYKDAEDDIDLSDV